MPFLFIRKKKGNKYKMLNINFISLKKSFKNNLI